MTSFKTIMNKVRLSDLAAGESGYIVKVTGHGAFRHRIMEMGFVKGKKVTVVKNAPLKDPIEFNLLGYNVSLRRLEASMVEVVNRKSGSIEGPGFPESTQEETIPEKHDRQGHIIQVALVGNPNAGKTTIFNTASRSREKIGNYGGVTVDSKTATLRKSNYTIQLTDLPGTYSLACYSPEELYVRDFLLENKPDIVINILDSSNLERNLYLTSQLIEMNCKMVVALNMYDELQQSGDTLDYPLLGKMLGIPFVPTVGSRGKGIEELLQTVIKVYTGEEPVSRNITLNYIPEIETSIVRLHKAMEHYDMNSPGIIPTRLLAIKLLEKDLHIRNYIINLHNYKEILRLTGEEQDRIEAMYGETTETLITDARYGFIAGAMKESFHAGSHSKRKTTAKLDTILTHRLLGFPVFALFIWLMFTCTFSLGRYPVSWIENGVHLINNLISNGMPEGSLKALLMDGIIGGVGGVIVFLPNILILFFFISLMEDTGYMARAAFIMDKLMHAIGLHGKSFIPMIMAFGCNVPAIMATRTIENRKDRILTILINPFMSCSARLPIYILLIGAIFPVHSGTILVSLYFTGIIMAVAVALIFKRLFFRGENIPFVMELPPYRMPTLQSTLKHMWDKASQYLKKMGGLIMAASILIWVLGYFPRQSINTNSPVRSFPGKAMGSNNRLNQLDVSEGEFAQSIEIKRPESNGNAERQEKSYIGQIGKWIEPVTRPLGFDWKMGVSLISGIVAKEIVVSTMGVIYQADDSGDFNESLTVKIRNAVYNDGPHQGKPVFTPLSSYSFLLFTLLYFPCIATIAAIRKESGSWKWALFAVFYTTGLAWMVSFIFYQIGNLLMS
jgi:ferrous iron transport protein B